MYHHFSLRAREADFWMFNIELPPIHVLAFICLPTLNFASLRIYLPSKSLLVGESTSINLFISKYLSPVGSKHSLDPPASISCWIHFEDSTSLGCTTGIQLITVSSATYSGDSKTAYILITVSLHHYQWAPRAHSSVRDPVPMH